MNPSPLPYVLVTPAHNEEALIEGTIESVLNQTLRPLKWIVVSDNSIDKTPEIVSRYAARYDFLELVELRRTQGQRHFGNKAHAFNAGLERVKALDYGFVGNLDADISLKPDYFENVLNRMLIEPRLGIAGGMVATRIGNSYVSQDVSLDSVAGAVQLFRRECFAEIGGYLPLPEGGIDSAAEIMARMKGWQVRTFPELHVLEHRRTGSAKAPPIAAKLREGQRLHSLGYGLLFLALRSVYRLKDQPMVIGSMATLAGYMHRVLLGTSPVLPPDVVSYLQSEQRLKLINTVKAIYVRHLRNF